jgi:hypothetical protein
MASPFTIPQIIQFAKISQYLAGNDIASKTALRSGSINENLPWLLYMEGYLLENMYTLNPGGSTLRKTAEYVLSLCGKYLNQAQTIINNLAAGLPVITGPSNQSVNQGASAIFTIAVVSSLSYTIQWYDFAGNPIVGQTGLSYVFSNAQTGDTGKTFYAKVTSAAGTTVSGIATLTVTANIIGRWYAGGTDYSTLLAAGTDTVAYSGTFTITDGQPLVVPFPAGQFDFIVAQYPVSQSVKTHYANPAGGFDQAAVPGLALAVNTFGGNNYIFSNGSPFGINNASGQITFS